MWSPIACSSQRQSRCLLRTFFPIQSGSSIRNYIDTIVHIRHLCRNRPSEQKTTFAAEPLSSIADGTLQCWLLSQIQRNASMQEASLTSAHLQLGRTSGSTAHTNDSRCCPRLRLRASSACFSRSRHAVVRSNGATWNRKVVHQITPAASPSTRSSEHCPVGFAKGVQGKVPYEWNNPGFTVLEEDLNVLSQGVSGLLAVCLPVPILSIIVGLGGSLIDEIGNVEVSESKQASRE